MNVFDKRLNELLLNIHTNINQADRLSEARSINSSLSALGNVITALATNADIIATNPPPGLKISQSLIN